MFLIGRLVSFVSINLFIVDYWEKRFVTLMFLIACLFAPIPLIKFREHFNRNGHRVLKSAAITSMLSVLILLGFSSTAVQSEFWFSFVNGKNFKLSEEELEAIGFLKDVFEKDNRAFTITPSPYSKEILTLAVPAYQFTKPDISIFSKYPDVPLLTLASHNLDHAYIYMHDRDFKRLENQVPHGWLDQHLIPLLPVVFSNQEVTIYNATKVSYPLPNSETTLIIPSDPHESKWFYAYDIVAQSGKNYTVKFDKDTQALKGKNVILSFDPTEGYSFYDNFSSSTNGKWDIVSGTGKWEPNAGALEVGDNIRHSLKNNILSPVISPTNSNISTSFALKDLNSSDPTYASIIHSWIDSKNYKVAGVTLYPKANESLGSSTSYEIYAYFATVVNGEEFWDPPWPGSKIGLDWDPGDPIRITLSLRANSQGLNVNGMDYLHKDFNSSNSSNKVGPVGLSFGRVHDGEFHYFSVEGQDKLDFARISEYISYANSGGNLTVLNTNGQNGAIADYLFNELLPKDNAKILNATLISNASDNILRLDTAANIKSMDASATSYNNRVVPLSSSVFSLESEIGRGKLTYINLYPLLSNLEENNISSGATTYTVLRNISDLIKGGEEIRSFRPNLNDIAPFFREVYGTGDRMEINAESAVFPADLEFSKLTVMQGDNNLTSLRNITSIEIDGYRNITMNARHSYMSITDGKGLYSKIYLNSLVDDSRFDLFFEDNATVKASDADQSFRFENVSGISSTGKNQNMNLLLRQPTIKIVDGDLTIKELHSTGQLYEETGSLGDDLKAHW